MFLLEGATLFIASTLAHQITETPVPSPPLTAKSPTPFESDGSSNSPTHNLPHDSERTPRQVTTLKDSMNAPSPSSGMAAQKIISPPTCDEPAHIVPGKRLSPANNDSPSDPGMDEDQAPPKRAKKSRTRTEPKSRKKLASVSGDGEGEGQLTSEDNKRRLRSNPVRAQHGAPQPVAPGGSAKDNE